jgi:SET domain-containing protein
MTSKRHAAWEVRESGIHGRGVFAHRSIPAGRRIVEYTGERLSADEADGRYDDKTDGTAHVLLFALEDGTYIDGGSGGSEARFINHSCAPNCEAVEVDGRIFIESLRTIRPGDEITYDYGLDLPGRHTKEVKAQYPCRCGAPGCRGTLLAPRRPSGRGRPRRK